MALEQCRDIWAWFLKLNHVYKLVHSLTHLFAPFPLASEVVSLLDLLGFPYMVSSSSWDLFSHNQGDYRNESEIAKHGLIVGYRNLKK